MVFVFSLIISYPSDRMIDDDLFFCSFPHIFVVAPSWGCDPGFDFSVSVFLLFFFPIHAMVVMSSCPVVFFLLCRSPPHTFLFFTLLFLLLSSHPSSRLPTQPVRMVEINFLCVHKRIRSKRLAPVLIQEITRRVNLQDIWQAAYTAGITIPKPIASTRYYHRSLNPAKLIDVNFSHLRKGMTIARTAKLYRLPDTPQLPGFRPMQEEDVESAHALLTRYLKRFKLAPNWSVEDFRHWFLPRKDVVYTYVIQVRGCDDPLFQPSSGDDEC